MTVPAQLAQRLRAVVATLDVALTEIQRACESLEELVERATRPQSLACEVIGCSLLREHKGSHVFVADEPGG